jgi:hypothetical protein
MAEAPGLGFFAVHRSSHGLHFTTAGAFGFGGSDASRGRRNFKESHLN